MEFYFLSFFFLSELDFLSMAVGTQYPSTKSLKSSPVFSREVI